MGPFPTFFVLTFLLVQVQGAYELNNDGILCIAANQEKSALERWLYCLGSQNAEDDYLEIIEDPATETFILPQELGQPANSKAVVVTGNPSLADAEEDLSNLFPSERVDVDADNFEKENLIQSHPLPATEPSVLPQELGQPADSEAVVVIGNPSLANVETDISYLWPFEKANLDADNFEKENLILENPSLADVEEDISNLFPSEKADVDADNFRKENLIQPHQFCQGTESKGIAITENQWFADGEENKNDLQSIDKRDVDGDQIKRTRSGKEDAVLGWLKPIIVIFAFRKLLLSLIKMNYQEASESSTKRVSEDSFEGLSEIKKSLMVDDTLLTNTTVTDKLQMLGSSLGSAVGAVFSEVLLKSQSSKSSEPADKICTVMEIALKDLFFQTQEDDCCSRVIRDFLTSFRTTYMTMHRIRQACASHGGSEVTHINLNKENRSLTHKSSFEKECRRAESCGGITENEDDAWQTKDKLCVEDANSESEQQNSTSSRPTVNKILELPHSPRTLEHRDQESACTRASAFDCHVSGSNVETNLCNMPCDTGDDDTFDSTLIQTTTGFGDKIVTHENYFVEDSGSGFEDVPTATDLNAVSRLKNTPVMGRTYSSSSFEFQNIFMEFYKRHVQAQEQQNHFKYTKLQHLLKQQTLEEEKIQLASAANGLMRESIELGRSKANFKENKALEQQMKVAHLNFCATCADELAAGLCVMLTALVYSVRMYSFMLLNDLVSMCQPVVKEPRRSAGFHMDWFYGFLDSSAGKLQTIVCHFAVTGRILIGSILVAIIAQSLLRRSVTSSSQTMPATILIIVLGGVCGFIGKVSVDSLGGNGNRWWIVWGIFCLLHALSNCFTPSIYRLLHGSPMRHKSKFGLPYWIRRFAFHATLVLFLPLLAGLLPFGNLSHVMSDLSVTLMERLATVSSLVSVQMAQLF